MNKNYCNILVMEEAPDNPVAKYMYHVTVIRKTLHKDANTQVRLKE